MTHHELVKVAQRWLVNHMRCGVVLTEIVSVIDEIPDAIGWKSSRSILVECKTSRADFMADQHKPSRRRDQQLGGKRFFLLPNGLIEPHELPQGWGLLEHHESGRVRMIQDCAWSYQRTESDYDAEITLLVSALRRIRQREFICIVPEQAIVEAELVGDKGNAE